MDKRFIGYLFLICPLLNMGMEQELVAVNNVPASPQSFKKQQLKQKRKAYRILADCIDRRNNEGIKPLIRILEHDNTLDSVLAYHPKKEKPLLELAKERTNRKTINIIRKRIVYAILLALCPTGYLGKLFSCPPVLKSLSFFSNIASLAACVMMFKTLAVDGWYLKDYLHNNSLKIALRLKHYELEKTLAQRSLLQPEQNGPVVLPAEIVRNDIFCSLRRAIQTRDLYNARKIIEKTSADDLRTVLLTPNPEGHKPLLAIAREYSKDKSVCVRSTKIGRIVKACILIAFVLLDTYFNGLELINGSRNCSTGHDLQRGQIAIGFTAGYMIFSIFYMITQMGAILQELDKERLHNDALRIYKKIVFKTDELLHHDPLNEAMV